MVVSGCLNLAIMHKLTFLTPDGLTEPCPIIFKYYFFITLPNGPKEIQPRKLEHHQHDQNENKIYLFHITSAIMAN